MRRSCGHAGGDVLLSAWQPTTRQGRGMSSRCCEIRVLHLLCAWRTWKTARGCTPPLPSCLVPIGTWYSFVCLKNWPFPTLLVRWESPVRPCGRGCVGLGLSYASASRRRAVCGWMLRGSYAHPPLRTEPGEQGPVADRRMTSRQRCLLVMCSSHLACESACPRSIHHFSPSDSQSLFDPNPCMVTECCFRRSRTQFFPPKPAQAASPPPR